MSRPADAPPRAAAPVVAIATGLPVAPPEAPSLAELAAQDLARSGVALAEAAAEGVAPVDSDAAWRILRPKHPERADDFTACGLAIPYRDPWGAPLNFARVRRLAGRWRRGDDPGQRYAQPPNSMPHLYLPSAAWRRWVGRPGEPVRVPRLVVTEGEKKALKACLCGIPAVAVGGVTAYQSARHRVPLLPEFGWFDLSGTDVDVVYDSDAYTNSEIADAMLALAWTLRRDAAPRSIGYRRLVAESTGGRTGLDDFLASFASAAEARAAYERLERVEDRAGEAFAVFNRDLVYVRKMARFYNVATGTWYDSRSRLVDEYAVGTPVEGPDGKLVHPIVRWFTDRPARTTVLRVAAEPGAPPRFRPEGSADDVLNLWRPSPLEPVAARRRSDLEPFLRFVRYLGCNLTDEERDWLLDWCAYPLQNPGRKCASAVLVWSESTGTGKSTLGRILRDCHGRDNTFELNGSALRSPYNDWATRQLVVVSEVHLPSYSERRAAMGDLKALITDDTVDLNRKFLPRENVPNHVNLYLTSNEPNALILDRDDRRFFVVEGPDAASRWPEPEFARFNGWLGSGGAELVLGFLLSRDLSAFDPFARPPRTAAWHDMVGEAPPEPIEPLVRALIATPALVLGAEGAGRVMWRPADLVERLAAYGAAIGSKARPTVARLRSALRAAPTVARGTFQVARGGERRLVTAYALCRDEDARARWEAAPPAEWRRALAGDDAAFAAEAGARGRPGPRARRGGPKF